jgi:hypothetical protein
MADIIVSYNLDDLSEIYFTDSSDIAPLSVNATRFVFSSVYGEANALQDVTDLKANVEYELVGTGSMTIDGKVFSAGDKFILRVDVTVTPPSTIKINETGYYSPVTSYLPTNDRLTLVPSQMGLGSNTVFPDYVFTGIYEVYTTKYAAQVSLPAGQYIVTGNGTISFDGIGGTYRVGEVVTLSAPNDFFDNLTGTNFVCKLDSSVTYYFQTYKYAYETYERYVEALAKGQCGTNLQANFLKVYNLLHTNILNFEKGISVDLQAMQDNLDTINNFYSNLNVYS